MTTDPFPEPAGPLLASRSESLAVLVTLLNTRLEDLRERPGDRANAVHDFKRWARVGRGGGHEAKIDELGKTPEDLDRLLSALRDYLRRYLAGEPVEHRVENSEEAIGVGFRRGADGRAVVVHSLPFTVSLVMRLGEDLISGEA